MPSPRLTPYQSDTHNIDTTAMRGLSIRSTSIKNTAVTGLPQPTLSQTQKQSLPSHSIYIFCGE